MVDLLVPEFPRLQAGFKLANVIEACYTNTAGHHERFRCPGIAFDSKNVDIKILEFEGIVQLMGKIILPSRVLKKTRPLDQEEWR
jgi:hypothetical protein